MSLILSSKAQLEQALSPYWKQGATIGFVPTMGALHAGHCSLMHAAKAVNEVVVLSIFVNPRQFNDSADFDKYPRTLTADIACAETEGVDFIYLPSYDELFSSHSVASEVQLNGLDLSMEGASRPGHFRGVVEVVYALFDHVNPSNAYFGQKDFQQLAIIRAMVSSLKLTVSIVSCPTLRETDGLAMSSRNLRLSQSERQEALVLYKALSFVRDYWQKRSPEELMDQAKQLITSSTLRLDYLLLVDPYTLLPIVNNAQSAVVCVAAYCGEVRLIDNMLLSAD
jgi:pantoate--beta-alanine ligase